MTLSEELAWRGFANQTTYKDPAVLDGGPITFYWGVDPSADSMTIGNLAAAMMVKALIKHGHQAVLLVGGATGMIGDPDGKSEERVLKSLDEITSNKRAIIAQYQQIFGGQDFQTVDNYDWFKGMNYLDFLRDTGKHASLRQMLNRDFVQNRLGEQNAGISYAEFSYVLIQAYDFLHLYKHKGVTLQVCGSDQWGNSIAGVDLIRRKTGGEAHVYSVPLITNKATGQKFGKSEEGAVWLDPAKTSPTQFYQFWINTDDAGVEEYLKVFTELDKAAINDIIIEHRKDRQLRTAQICLAQQVTSLLHGDEAAGTAQTITEVLTGRTAIDEVSDIIIDTMRGELQAVHCGASGSIVDILAATGLAASNTEARRLISDNAISINNAKVNREHFESADFLGGRLLIRKGKRFKDSALVELG